MLSQEHTEKTSENEVTKRFEGKDGSVFVLDQNPEVGNTIPSDHKGLSLVITVSSFKKLCPEVTAQRKIRR